jgi:alkylation response protein AidB-like acyl-CoA dehydrogenase
MKIFRRQRITVQLPMQVASGGSGERGSRGGIRSGYWTTLTRAGPIAPRRYGIAAPFRVLLSLLRGNRHMTISESLSVTIEQEDGRRIPEEILACARSVAPVLRECSDEIERTRRLPKDIVELLRGTGVFRMAAPKSWGGPELTSVEQTKVVEALAVGDASAAWCAMIGMDTQIYAGYLDEPIARTMFPSLDMITAGFILPIGRAERVTGGYRVSGYWKFASGITHCDWVVAGCLVYSNGQPEPNPNGGPVHWRIMMARPDVFDIVDTWFTTGLAGSGSRDYKVSDLFVPEEHSFSFAQPKRTGPLSPPDAILRNVPGVPLGVARAALDYVRSLAATRIDRTTRVAWPEDYRVQITFAEAEMDLLAARDAVYSSLQRQWDRLESGENLSVEERVSPVLARVNAFRVARSILSRLYDLVATTAIYLPSPLDRWLRDLYTMRQHVIAQDKIVQSAGALLLGGTPQNLFGLGLVG